MLIKIKLKNCMIISIDAQHVFDKIQYKLTIKTLSKLGIEGNLLNLIKYVYEKKTDIILHGE